MTVRQLLSEIDSRELTEWMAYYQLEPFGEERADLRSGIVASTIANAFRGKHKEFKPMDFVPDFGKKHSSGRTSEHMKAVFSKLKNTMARKRKNDGN